MKQNCTVDKPSRGTGTEDMFESPESWDPALQVSELAGFNAKVKKTPSQLVMENMFWTSKIRKAVFSAKPPGS